MALKHSAHFSFGNFITFTGQVAECFLGDQSYDEFWLLSLNENSDRSVEDAVKEYLEEMDYKEQDLARDLDLIEDVDRKWEDFTEDEQEVMEAAFEQLIDCFERDIIAAVDDCGFIWVFFVDEQEFRAIDREEMEDIVADMKTGVCLETSNSHCHAFGGSHAHWYDTKTEEYKCYGSGPNWRDQDDSTSLQEVEDIVDMLEGISDPYDPCCIQIYTSKPDHWAI